MQLLEERDAELERTEASLEGHKKASDARETVRTPLLPRAKVPVTAWLHLHVDAIPFILVLRVYS